jgi:hypothetical protein
MLTAWLPWLAVFWNLHNLINKFTRKYYALGEMRLHETE